MMFRPILLALLVSVVLGKSLESRNIYRSGSGGDVSLVEFNIKGTVYGKCSYVNSKGEQTTVIYEERKGKKLVARSTNPTVINPVEDARQCKQLAATNVPAGPEDNSVQGRTNQYHPYHYPIATYQTFANYQRNLNANQRYVNQLQPRIFGGGGGGFFGGPNFSYNQDYQNLGISFGGDYDNNNRNFGLNLMTNNDENLFVSHGFGNWNNNDNSNYFSPLGMFGFGFGK